MTRHFLPLLAALAVLAASPPVFSADEPAGDLKYIPPDAAVFIYLDVAALSQTKVNDTLQSGQSAAVILDLAPVSKMTGYSIADVKSVQFSYPTLSDQTAANKSMSVVSFRRKYDREKLIVKLKESAKTSKGEFSEAKNLVRVTTPLPFAPDQKVVTTYDLTEDTRIITLVGLGDEYLKPSEVKGIHSAALKGNASAAVIAGLNFTALPDEFRGENLPAELRPFRPIRLSDGLMVVGTIVKDKLNVTVTVKAKTKGDAAEVEKSLDAGRQLADTLITSSKKTLNENVEKPKEVAALFDVLQAAMKDANFSVSDATTTASLTLPLDAPYGPFFDLLSGGGASARSQSSNNLKQLGLGMHNYESANNHLPTPATLGKKGKKLHSWRVEILPYIGSDELYKKFKLDEPWDSEHNLKVVKDNPMPKTFAIPGTTNEADNKTHYQVFVGNGAMFEPTGPTKITDILDGTSNTFMIATAAKAVEWTKPDDIEFDPKEDIAKLLLFKDGVCVIAFGDGSVRAISEKVDVKNLKAMITRAGGEVVGEDD